MLEKLSFVEAIQEEYYSFNSKKHQIIKLVFDMKNNKKTTVDTADYSTINTQQYVDIAHKLRGEALSEHIGIIKNVFKRKNTGSNVKK